MMDVLDKKGLTYLWSKFKTLLSSHKASVTAIKTEGTKIATIDGVDIFV